MPKVEAAAADPYARITVRILEQLEQGVRPWTKPWSADHLGGRVTRPYAPPGSPIRGSTSCCSGWKRLRVGHPSPTWMTYRQAQAFGGQVRKGERGCPVVYFGATTRRGADEGAPEPAGDGQAREVRFLKTYTVFNLAQIDGLPERFAPDQVQVPPLPAPQRIAHAEAFFGALGIEVRHGGAQAYYSANDDRIQLPPLEAFHDAESYYATLGHEAVHATRHPSRLDRDFGRQRFGDEGYAREELVAELGSAFLAADLGLYLEPRDDHAAYLAGWIKVLQGDTRAIVSAAAHAERAVKLLHGMQALQEAVP